MRNLLWRVVYAVVCVVIFLWIVPLFLAVVGFPAGGALWELLRACVACLAVLYVLFGPPPSIPW